MEHDGFPDDFAFWPAMPCEMHTPPRRTLPSALGPGALPRPRSARHAERSRLHPKTPPQRPGGAGPPGPCGLSCRSPQHRPYHSPYTHVPLPLPLSLAQPHPRPTAHASAPAPASPRTWRKEGREGGLQPTSALLPTQGLWGRCTSSPPGCSCCSCSCRAAVGVAAFLLLPSSSRITATAFVLQVLQPLLCCSLWAAAHCSQPPPRCQSRGYGGAAVAAILLQSPQRQLLCHSGCSSCPAAVVMQQHFSHCFRAAGTAAALLLQHVDCSSLLPTPIPLPMQGLRGRCTRRLPAAAAAAAASCCSGCGSFPAAAISQQHFSSCRCTAGAAAAVLLQLVGGPAPLPGRGGGRGGGRDESQLPTCQVGALFGSVGSPPIGGKNWGLEG